MNFELLFLLFSCFFPSLKSPSNPVYGVYLKPPKAPNIQSSNFIKMKFDIVCGRQMTAFINEAVACLVAKQKSRKHTLPGQNKLLLSYRPI